jgi:ABC-type transporter Mla maintaining outer membrane lipid asymmetry ATPase subunit MlaF
MHNTPVIEISHLWTQFGDVVVHKDLSMEVQQGDIVSLVGGSGSGKTTLLRQMLGLETPTRGTPTVSNCSSCAIAGACCSSKARCSLHSPRSKMWRNQCGNYARCRRI